MMRRLEELNRQTQRHSRPQLVFDTESDEGVARSSVSVKARKKKKKIA